MAITAYRPLVVSFIVSGYPALATAPSYEILTKKVKIFSCGVLGVHPRGMAHIFEHGQKEAAGHKWLQERAILESKSMM
jgi:hypothetical protein